MLKRLGSRFANKIAGALESRCDGYSAHIRFFAEEMRKSGLEVQLLDVGSLGGIVEPFEEIRDVLVVSGFDPQEDKADAGTPIEMKEKDRTKIYPFALYTHSGEVTFNVTRAPEWSSVYKPNRAVLSRYNTNLDFADILRTVSVRSERLDDALKDQVIDFVKIDTQGSELDILKHGKTVLQNCLGILTEVEFVHFYENQPLFADIDPFIRSQGFELFDLRRAYYKRKSFWDLSGPKGQIIGGDALYLRPPEQLVALGKDKIIKGLLLYLLFGYVDLAFTLYELSELKTELTWSPEPHRLKQESEGPFGTSLTRLFSTLSSYLNPHDWRKGQISYGDRPPGNRI